MTCWDSREETTLCGAASQSSTSTSCYHRLGLFALINNNHAHSKSHTIYHRTKVA
jgi:hypothetical protein